MRGRSLRASISPFWLVLMVAMIALIWGNSLVPGEGSSSISLAVMNAVHGVLRAFNLPYEWVTNFLIRKTAHFTEYAVLGVLASQAFDPQRTVSRRGLIAAAVVCVLVPSIDETIQLFVSDRSGQVTDVLLDCCGAATGIFLRTQMTRFLPGRKRVKRAN